MAKSVDITTLVREVRQIHDAYPTWTIDNAFVHWFLQAFLVADADTAARAVTGISHDKGVDAVHVDDTLGKVFVLQGKFHQGSIPLLESRSHVMAFAQIARKIAGPKTEFAAYLSNIDPTVGQKLSAARDRISKRNYELHLYYVTTGKCSTPLKGEAESEGRQVNARASITVLDRPDVLALLIDYLGGAAPPVPYLDLKVDTGGVVGSSGVIHRAASDTGINSWVLTMLGKDLAHLYAKAGDRLFSRNIRGFLGDTAINEQMKETLKRQPHQFWYFNNGVTIVCDSARMTSDVGGAILRVTNPQIINGQQTTRTLHESGARTAAVLVRVISIPREVTRNQEQFESIVSNIVAATNWQNAILQSDLRANDSRQVALQRDFAKVHYHYIRKRQTKKEARRALGNQHWFWIKKDELAQVVGACELDPYFVRSGKEGLFKAPHYDRIFDGRPLREYLAMYQLGRIVKYHAAGRPNRAYAKWHALHFLWGLLGPVLRSKARAEEFRTLSERDRLPPAIDHVAEQVFNTLIEFFRKKRGKGASATDISNFFYRPHRHTGFDRFWHSPRNRRRTRTKALVRRFGEALDESIAV